MEICLVVLIGIPGVGKTHLCEFITKNLCCSTVHISHISYDDCEADLSSNIYKNFRKNVYNKVKKLIENITEINDKKQYFLLIDDNMYYRSMRRVYYNLAKHFEISFCQIFVTCPVELALKRNSNRSFNHVPCTIINDMYKKLEVPLLDNNWEKYSVTINSQDPFTTNHVDVVRKLFAESLLSPVLKRDLVVNYNHASFIHTIDLTLRKIVNLLMKEHTGKNTLTQVSQDYSVKKKYILSGLKNGELFLPEFENDEFLYEFLLNMICNITL